LQLLANTSGPLPTREFGLIEVEGTLSHFAGSGWDAMILDDYKQQLAASRGPGRRLSKSVYGYLSAALVRTTPKVLLFGNPHLVIENLGDAVYSASDDSRSGCLGSSTCESTRAAFSRRSRRFRGCGAASIPLPECMTGLPPRCG
jgi:hypothetical protein